MYTDCIFFLHLTHCQIYPLINLFLKRLEHDFLQFVSRIACGVLSYFLLDDYTVNFVMLVNIKHQIHINSEVFECIAVYQVNCSLSSTLRYHGEQIEGPHQSSRTLRHYGNEGVNWDPIRDRGISISWDFSESSVIKLMKNLIFIG